MSGLLLICFIKITRKLVCASFRAVESLVLAILIAFAGRTFVVIKVSQQRLKNKMCRRNVDEKGSEDGRWSIKFNSAETVYGLWDGEAVNACRTGRLCCSRTRRLERPITMIGKDWVVGPTYKNGMKDCRDWDTMVYRIGDDHQLPVEGKVEFEGKKEGWSVWKQDWATGRLGDIRNRR